MVNVDDLLFLTAGFLLLIVNWLAFHNFHETHTLRD